MPRMLPLLFLLLTTLHTSNVQGEELFDGPELVGTPTPEVNDRALERRVVAQVGTGEVLAGHILEIWEPSWFNLIQQTRRGEITPEACDAKLQQAWSDALKTALQDELFYLEAEREFEMLIKSQAKAMVEMESGGSGHGNPPPGTLLLAERRMRERFEKSVERSLSQFVSRYAKGAGGMSNLRKVIGSRGLTWDEWRDRLRRKAFTDEYLQNILGPRVPRHPRPVDIRNYYRDHPDEFTRPGSVSFRHILFSFAKRDGEEGARVAANNVYDAIAEKKLPFAEAASKYSDDPESAARGGLESGVSENPERELWLAEIRGVVAEEAPGALGPILVSNVGVHLAMLEKQLPGEKIPFTEAQVEIRNKLFAEQWTLEVEKLYVELTRSVRVQVLMPHFPESHTYAASRTIPETFRPRVRHIVTEKAPTPGEGE